MLRITNDNLIDSQVVQVVSFTILNDSTFEARSSKEGKRWQQAMRIIQCQKGWIRTLFGRDINASHRVDIYIGKRAIYIGFECRKVHIEWCIELIS